MQFLNELPTSNRNNQEASQMTRFITQVHTQHKKMVYISFVSTYNCSSEFVIYCLSCPCSLLYIGRTIYTLRKRFGEHKRSIEECKELMIPRHFTEFHQCSPKGLQVWVAETIPNPPPPGQSALSVSVGEILFGSTLWIVEPWRPE